MVHLTAEAERRLIGDLLRAHGASTEEAEIVSEVLLEADLRGHDSHGLARIDMQIERIRGGAVIPGSQPSIERERPASVVVDGNRSLGPACVRFALNEALQRAKQQGSCTVAMHNHGYIAYLGRYVELGLDDDCVCILLARAKSGVHPYGGLRPMLGSDPIAAAIPTAGDPLLIDLSTSAAAGGKLLEAIRAGASIPEGWAVDSQGRPTTDPTAGKRGALSPLGGAKGYALGLLIELLAGLLAGGGAGPDMSSSAASNLWSSLAIVLHVPAFMDPSAFRSSASAYLARIKASPVAPGFQEILLPGERAYRLRRERLQSGIPIPDEAWQAVASYCLEAGLDAGSYAA